MKLERTSDEGVDEVCFSRSPITACRRHCMTQTTSQRTVSFVCLPRFNSEARRLLSKYHSGQTLLTDEILSIQQLSSSQMTRQIEVAEQCESNL